jgi:putative oxidoreductase
VLRAGDSGVSLTEYISPLIGRCVLAWFFLSQAWTYSHSWDATVQTMAMQQIPIAPVLLVLALAVMILGGLSLAIGLHARHGALLLFAFTMIASLLMHPFWKIAEGAAREADYEIFIRNVAIAGALLMIIGLGPGRFAIDNAGKKGR